MTPRSSGAPSEPPAANAPSEPAADVPIGTRTRAGLLLVGLSFVGFVSLGLPDGLLGVAWPSMRRDFAVPLDALGGLLTTLVAGYLCASASSGRIVARLGVGRLLALSCLATALGLVGIALTPSWLVLVAIGVVVGLGAGAIDAGLNAFAAVYFSPRLVNWLHASYSVGVTIGPVLMGVILDVGLPWRWGYAIVGAAQCALGVAFFATAGRWVVSRASAAAEAHDAASGPVRRPLVLWLGVVLFFVYTGLEVTAGGWAYSLLVEARGVEPGPASLAVSAYWGMLGVGRVLFGVVADRLAPSALVRACIVGMTAGGGLVWLDAGYTVTVVGLGMVGLAAAPVFPALISATPRRLGVAGTADAVGYQVSAAALGGALLPGLAGLAAERTSLEVVPPILVLLGALLFALHEALVRRAGR